MSKLGVAILSLLLCKAICAQPFDDTPSKIHISKGYSQQKNLIVETVKETPEESEMAPGIVFWFGIGLLLLPACRRIKQAYRKPT